MNILEFLKTIYLGDRGCKSILIDGWCDEVKIQIDCISRVRDKTWNYYRKEDLENGFIVFERVRSISIKPDGVVPNGFINDISAELVNENEYLIKLNIDADTSDGFHSEAVVQIIANSIALEECGNHSNRIRN